jgi:hypothetical protein
VTVKSEKEEEYVKKLFVTAVLLSFLVVSPVLAASPKQENIFVDGSTSYACVQASSNNPGNITLFSTNSVTHYSSVSSSYGLFSCCVLNGSAWCESSAGVMTPANYTVSTVFYHSNGDSLNSASISGSSSSSTKFSWSASDDSGYSFHTASTSTSTSCSKIGYSTVVIPNTTTNPHY